MSDFDRDSVIRRIRGLMEKTVANGCTEAEAMAASQAAGAMLNKYQLSLSDIKIREEVCKQGDMRTSTKDGGPMFWMCKAIANFTDTKSWRSLGAGPLGTAVFRYFGLETDVIVATYLHEMIERASLYAWEDHRRAIPGYTQMSGSRKTQIKNGFYAGFATRMTARLNEMKAAQRRDNVASTGRDLVVVKGAVVDAEFAKLGIELKMKRATNIKMDHDVWHAGAKAAENVALNPGVKQDQRGRLS